MHKATVNINFQGTSKADHRCIQQLSAAQKKKKVYKHLHKQLYFLCCLPVFPQVTDLF